MALKDNSQGSEDPLCCKLTTQLYLLDKVELSIRNSFSHQNVALKDLTQGSEDPAGAENLQRCEELLPGTVTIPECGICIDFDTNKYPNKYI